MQLIAVASVIERYCRYLREANRKSGDGRGRITHQSRNFGISESGPTSRIEQCD
jgi:hypothetical protein